MSSIGQSHQVRMGARRGLALIGLCASFAVVLAITIGFV